MPRTASTSSAVVFSSYEGDERASPTHNAGEITSDVPSSANLQFRNKSSSTNAHGNAFDASGEVDDTGAYFSEHEALIESQEYDENAPRHRRSGSGLEAPANATPLDPKLRQQLWWRNAAISSLFILAWYFFSTLISLYNKWMFSSDHMNFPYPLFVTCIHMVVQWSLSYICLSVFKQLSSPNKPTPKEYGTKVVPCGVATGLDIGLSNLSLRSITLSFYTMCKSSSLAFVLLFAFAFRLEKPSLKLIGIITIITAGVVLMVSTETQFDFAGMLEVLSAAAMGGLRWSLTQILLDKESMGMSNPISTLFYIAPIMGLTLGLVSMLFDGWFTVFSNEQFFGSFSTTLWTCMAILFPGVLAFLMNITEFGLIQRTSVVTLSVAGIFKEVAVIFLSTLIFHDQLTPINVSGLLVTITGISLYNFLKYKQYTSANEEAEAQNGGNPSHVKLEDESDPFITRNDGRVEDTPVFDYDLDHPTDIPLATTRYSEHPYGGDNTKYIHNA